MEPTKDMETVERYKQEQEEKSRKYAEEQALRAKLERHKWNLSMAKNNAAVLCANDLAKMSPRQLESGEHMLLMKMTIRQLYETYNELDDELKDELPK